MADLQKMEEDLQYMEKCLHEYYDMFIEDGVIDNLEQTQIDSMLAVISRAAERIGEIKSQTPEDVSTKVIKKGKITATVLNVRKGPSTANEKVGKLKKGAAVEVFEEQDGWYRIGDNKWVSGDYVAVSSKEEATTEPVDIKEEVEDKKEDPVVTPTDGQQTDLVGNNPTKQAVGAKKSPNDPADVITIKKLLNSKGATLTLNGTSDADLVSAIKAYQKDKMGSSKPDGIVDAGKNTWKHLNGIAKTDYTGATKGFRPQDQQDLDWKSDTEREQKLEEFFDDFSHLKVLINPGQTPPQYLEVVPVYEINSSKSKCPKGKPISSYGFTNKQGQVRTSLSLAEYWSKFPNAAKNSKVYKIRQKLPWHAQAGKATPGDITGFLNDCVQQGLVPEKQRTKLGFRDFLIAYEVGVDCTGLVSQALNFLSDGDMDYKRGEDAFNITSSMKHKQKFKVIGKPADLKAGDMMQLEKRKKGGYGHVRIVVDVDAMPDGSVQVRTVESGGGGKNSGVGSALWKYPSAESFDGLERSDDNGKTWYPKDEHKSRSMTYQRWEKLDELPE